MFVTNPETFQRVAVSDTLVEGYAVAQPRRSPPVIFDATTLQPVKLSEGERTRILAEHAVQALADDLRNACRIVVNESAKPTDTDEASYQSARTKYGALYANAAAAMLAQEFSPEIVAAAWSRLGSEKVPLMERMTYVTKPPVATYARHNMVPRPRVGGRQRAKYQRKQHMPKPFMLPEDRGTRDLRTVLCLHHAVQEMDDRKVSGLLRQATAGSLTDYSGAPMTVQRRALIMRMNALGVLDEVRFAETLKQLQASVDEARFTIHMRDGRMFPAEVDGDIESSKGDLDPEEIESMKRNPRKVGESAEDPQDGFEDPADALELAPDLEGDDQAVLDIGGSYYALGNRLEDGTREVLGRQGRIGLWSEETETFTDEREVAEESRAEEARKWTTKHVTYYLSNGPDASHYNLNVQTFDKERDARAAVKKVRPGNVWAITASTDTGTERKAARVVAASDAATKEYAARTMKASVPKSGPEATITITDMGDASFDQVEEIANGLQGAVEVKDSGDTIEVRFPDNGMASHFLLWTKARHMTTKPPQWID